MTHRTQDRPVPPTQGLADAAGGTPNAGPPAAEGAGTQDWPTGAEALRVLYHGAIASAVRDIHFIEHDIDGMGAYAHSLPDLRHEIDQYREGLAALDGPPHAAEIAA